MRLHFYKQPNSFYGSIPLITIYSLLIVYKTQFEDLPIDSFKVMELVDQFVKIISGYDQELRRFNCL